MTEVFNIDLEVNGFRQNKLDLRRFHETYNKVSDTKLEQGITPLPLPLFLKLFGPQKVLSTYVKVPGDRRLQESILGTTQEGQGHSRGLDMRPSDNRDTSVSKTTLDFPGTGFVTVTDTSVAVNAADVNAKARPVAKTTVSKRDALPTRPALQRNMRVPGRYFPKPMTSGEEHNSLNSSFSDGTVFRNSYNRAGTQTPHSSYSNCQTPSSGRRGNTPGTRRSQSTRESARIRKGPSMAKVTPENLSQYGRTQTWSGSGAGYAPSPTRSVPTVSNGHGPVRKPNKFNQNMHGRSEQFFLGFRGGDDRPGTDCSGYTDPFSDISCDFSVGKRLRYSHRQVSFPPTSASFTAVLHGKPKTLHQREAEAMEEVNDKVGRSRTQVGFVDDDT